VSRTVFLAPPPAAVRDTLPAWPLRALLAALLFTSLTTCFGQPIPQTKKKKSKRRRKEKK
jgi:hypothetical protein